LLDRQRRKCGLGRLAIWTSREGCGGGLDDVRDHLGIDHLGIDGLVPVYARYPIVQILTQSGRCPLDAVCYPPECRCVGAYLRLGEPRRFAVDGSGTFASRYHAPR
jgi:hypothetical protein